MLLPDSKQAIHKAWLYRLLAAIYDNQTLSGLLYFKGGTCAAMLGWLDRFSIDLDFDFVGKKKDLSVVKKELKKVFMELGLIIKDESKKAPQYFLKYPAKPGTKNTIKIDTTYPPPKANAYQPYRFEDIDRIIYCQTIETMFANKLVTVLDRWEKHRSIAGRDIYDIHYFFLNGHEYEKAVITERRKKPVDKFMKELLNFIDKKVNQKVIDQDINHLISADRFQKIRKVLKREVLMFLKDEVKRLYNLGR